MERIMRILIPAIAICIAAFFIVESLVFYENEDKCNQPENKLETLEDMIELLETIERDGGQMSSEMMNEFLQDGGEIFANELLERAADMAMGDLEEFIGRSIGQ